MHNERVEFMAPKGVVPEDIKPGDTFDLVSTYRLKPSGDICLIQIGDTQMPGYDDAEEEYNEKSKTTRQSYGNVMDSMHSAMSGSGGGGPGNTDEGGY